MKKEKFIELMTEFVSINTDGNNLNEAFRKFDPDFNFISFGRQKTLFVDCMKEAMNDEADWISYWLWELNCGKDAKLNTVQDNKGNDIPIKTLSDLYDIIVNKIG